MREDTTVALPEDLFTVKFRTVSEPARKGRFTVVPLPVTTISVLGPEDAIVPPLLNKLPEIVSVLVVLEVLVISKEPLSRERFPVMVTLFTLEANVKPLALSMVVFTPATAGCPSPIA